jgi:ribosomal protein L7/L12 domain protein
MKNNLSKSMYAAIAALFIAMPQQGMAQEVYGLKIAGVAVTSENCNDLSVIKGVTGNAKYDNDSKKLTLDGATIHATSAHGLENRIDGLIIRVTNESAITSDKKVGIWNMDKDISIIGDGKLTLTGSSTASDDKYNKAVFNQGTIAIRDCSVEASGGSNGLYGGYWTFDNCNVRAKGGSKSNSNHKGSIAWVWDRIPTFTDCAITSPAGTYWEEIEEYEYPYFYLYDSDRNVLTDWVVISKGASGINSAATDTAAKKHGIYTLDGVRINGKFESLPAGIYIVDGKKTVKK